MRIVLVAAVAGFAIVSGCIGMSGGGTPQAEEVDPPTVAKSVDFGTRTAESGATDHISISNGTLVVNRTITANNTEYLSDSNSVRYVERWKHADHEAVENGSKPDREPVYGVLPFEEWGRIQCSSTAVDGVWTALKERTEGSLDAISVSSNTSGERIRITVMRTTTLDRDGNVESEPSISYDRLDAVTPGDAAVGITFENRSYACQPSVSVTNTTLHES